MAKILNWRLLKAHIWCLKKAVAVSSCRFFFSFLHLFCLMCPKRLQLQIQNAVILPHAQPKSNYTTQEMFSVYQHWGDTFKKVRLKKKHLEAWWVYSAWDRGRLIVRQRACDCSKSGILAVKEGWKSAVWVNTACMFNATGDLYVQLIS